MTEASNALWRDYSRSKLPRGFSHVVGRDQVERSLRHAGAVLDTLSFGPPFTEKGATSSMVFDVYWTGDGSSRISTPRDWAARRLLMRWSATTSSLRAAIAPEVVSRWLPEACAWAAAAPDQGNTWGASDHRWMLTEKAGALSRRIDLL